MQKLIGTGVALITPFKKDSSIDIEALKRLVQFQIENGIDYIVVLGTTAESATLSDQEKGLVIDTIVAANAGRIPLVLGIGGNNTQQVIEEIQTRDLSAFDAILSVSPYYNKPTQEGIFQHFKAIAESTTKPIILYNVPGRTASNMLPETVFRLAASFSNIVAIKEAAGDVVQAMRLIKDNPKKDFLIISGDDMITLPMILAGGSGVISVLGEGLPKPFSKMVQLALARQTDEAYALHYQLMHSIDLIFEQGNPAGIKELMAQLGLCESVVRLPLVDADDALKNKIKSELNQLKILAYC
ncbi:MAG: 4-hydroxy-tetrahydrodipicolinate synthase [Flavobacterium sp. BFFFF2]|nr:MAG: 4-hydroxy-tetrahydrodipicolinate synthase [Flavobacterium sp. BFFFF2]